MGINIGTIAKITLLTKHNGVSIVYIMVDDKITCTTT